MTEGSGDREIRSAYLIDGRRVTVSDLIDAGLLDVGARLRFSRPRIGDVHHAEITADGLLRLEDGQEYTSTSRAAAIVADMRAVDGWHAWVIESTGASLDSLRQALLDKVANDDPSATAPAIALSDAQRRHERLKEARSRADMDDPVDIRVRELLALWGAKSRGQRICQRIEADLSNHGLVTSPSFRKVTIDAAVQLIPTPQEVPISVEADGQVTETDDESVELEAVLTIGNIVPLDGRVASVAPTASLDEAITRMLLDDYSQLAVLSGKHTLRGAITWKSITQARHRDPTATLADCIVTDAPVAPYDRELMDVLPVLKEHEFVFVRDNQNAIAGILTYADVVQHYGVLSTPFLLIGDLDQRLRALISKTFSLNEVKPLCDPQSSRDICTFDDLTIGDYQQILGNPDLWAKLGWPLDRQIFNSRLDELRQARNDVMHFNPDGVLDETVVKLRAMLGLLRAYCQ